MISKEVLEKILESAIFLDEYNLHDIAWHRKDAVDVLHSIMDQEIGVLGGDVYILQQHFLEPLSDSWYSEPLDGEAEKNYHRRSKQEALDYIQKYPILLEENIIFAIIFSESLH